MTTKTQKRNSSCFFNQPNPSRISLDRASLFNPLDAGALPADLDNSRTYSLGSTSRLVGQLVAACLLLGLCEESACAFFCYYIVIVILHLTVVSCVCAFYASVLTCRRCWAFPPRLLGPALKSILSVCMPTPTPLYTSRCVRACARACVYLIIHQLYY